MKKWDVFISHASEDKEIVALPLARLLSDAGLVIWIDHQELKLGDSLREKIDNGLAESSFGVVVLSKTFVTKGWPTRELNGLFALEEDGQKVILPVWHEISKAELAAYSPILADRLAANTSKGIKEVARDILEVVLSSAKDTPSVLTPNTTRLLLQLLEVDPPVEKIVQFVSMHTKVLTGPRVLFQPLVELSPVAGRSVPFAQLDRSSTSNDEYITLIDFANVSGRLLRDDGTPEADVRNAESRVMSLMEWANANRSAFLAFCQIKDYGGDLYVSSRVYARRRDSLTGSERSYFSRQSRERPSSNGRTVHIELRSYDHLVEQARAWCSDIRNRAFAHL